MTRRISTLKLHQYRYGELPPDERAEIERLIAEDPELRSRLQAQENQRAAFELSPVPDAIKKLAAPPSPANNNRGWVLLTAPLMLAAIALIAVPRAQVPALDGTPVISSDVRLKGDNNGIEAWMSTAEGPRKVDDGARLHPGDRIQVRVRRPSAPWVTVAGTGPDGSIEVYGSWEADMSDGGWQSAPFALGLDDTLGSQAVHTVFTEHRPSDDQVRDLVIDNQPDIRTIVYVTVK